MAAVAYRSWDDELVPMYAACAPAPELFLTSSQTIDSAILLGLDVSHYDGDVDFAQVKAAGASFVFIKASEGSTIVDENFAANWKAAKAAGMIRGAYHLFRPKDDVQSQVANFVNTVGSIETGDLPPVIDIEVPEDWAQFTEARRVTMVLSWLQAVEAKLDIKPIIYIDGSMVESTLGSPEAFKDYLLWLADWTSSFVPVVPSPWTTWTFWQYTDTGTIAGIDGEVDLDRFAGSLVDLQKLQFVAAQKQTAQVVPFGSWLNRLREMLGCKYTLSSTDGAFC
jgi:lysozyme